MIFFNFLQDLYFLWKIFIKILCTSAQSRKITFYSLNALIILKFGVGLEDFIEFRKNGAL